MFTNFSFIFSDCHAAQTFEKQPDYNEVNPGSESIVTCKIYNKKGQCSWQKDGKVSVKGFFVNNFIF